MDIELYYTPHTRSGRPRWLLEELGIPYRLRPVDLFNGERNPAHPLGSVPALRVDGRTLIESGAMCHWLTDCFPEAGLAPDANDPPRAEYEQWMFFTPGTLEPPAFDILLHSTILPEAQRVPAIIDYARQRYRRVLDMLSPVLETRAYLLGDRFSTADILLGHTLTWLPAMLEPYPALQSYVERLTTRTACQRASQPLAAA